MDTELLAIEKDIGNLLADKLVEVYRKDGVKEYILLHVEIQGRSQKHFSQRMFEYFCRLYSIHKKPIFCIAILTSKSQWHPEPFSYTFGTRTFIWTYDIIKLWEQRNNPILKLSNNPFAKVIELQLAANEKRKTYKNKYDDKLLLFKQVLSLEYSKEYIKVLYSFVDYLFQLPKNLEKECKNEIIKYAKESKMTYITSMERISREEGKLSILFNLLERKFGNLNDKIIARLNNASPQEIDAIAYNILTAENVDELFSEKVKA